MLMSNLRSGIIAAITLLVAIPALAQVPSPTASNEPPVFSPAQNQAIERLVHAYIIKHPEILQEAQTALETRAETQRLDLIRVHLVTNREAIYRDPQLPMAGNPKGDVTIVEFMDYNCPFCKKASADIARLIASDPNVKVVFQEFANLSAASEGVAKVTVAARAQGKYYELHRALMDAKGQLTDVRAFEIAAKLGLDIAKLKRDAAAAETKAIVSNAHNLAAKLSIENTPMFLIGDRYVVGMPGNFYEELERNVAEVRKAGCTIC
jgi:protein-disulfide isomerase